MAGPSALTINRTCHPARWAGLGKSLGLWPEGTAKSQLQNLRVGLSKSCSLLIHLTSNDRSARERSKIDMANAADATTSPQAT